MITATVYDRSGNPVATGTDFKFGPTGVTVSNEHQMFSVPSENIRWFIRKYTKNDDREMDEEVKVYLRD